VLDLSLRDRNELLQAAGIAAAYPAGGLSAAQSGPFRRAVDRLLRAHEPYPALVLDPHSTVLAANGACQRLYGRDLTAANMIRLYLAEPGIRDAIVNWPQVARAALARLRKQLRRTPFDDELQALITLAEATRAGQADSDDEDQAVLACPWFRVGDSVIRTIVMTGHFDATSDVDVDELRIELIYPQDDAAEAFFRRER
jgi:hypothetical protein